MQMIREDFVSLQVNYAVLPDLNWDGSVDTVGSGKHRSSKSRALVSDVSGKMSVRGKEGRRF